MVSKFAKEAVEMMQKDGLKPSYEDIIRLNALGLSVERGDSAADFAALPRVAFLGDYVLTEPTVAKWMWLDAARQLFGGDYTTELVLTAYALNTSGRDLPNCNDKRKIRKALERFRDEVLSAYTLSEIEAAVDYALNGSGNDVDESPEPTAKEKAAKKARELPEAVRSQARAILAYAVTGGISNEAAMTMTIPALERMVAVAAMLKGADALKGEHDRAVADFYRTADAIRERLKKEVNNG